jgi:hypothetical protein
LIFTDTCIDESQYPDLPALGQPSVVRTGSSVQALMQILTIRLRRTDGERGIEVFNVSQRV